MPSRIERRALVWFTAALALLCVLLAPARADAYPWMLRHGTVQCGTCHVDPSGAGLLTRLGRVRGERTMRFHYGAPSKDASVGKPFFGVDLPSWLELGGSIRNGLLVQNIPHQPSPPARLLQMQADLRGQVTVERFRANVSLGFLRERGEATRITQGERNNLVSREHWLGLDLGDEREWLVRAGRINLPYGLRGNEHTMWVRSTLRIDINEGQQHGAAVAYAAGPHRGELMLVLGNLQLRPDVYREQGLVGYYEHALGKRAAVGASALLLHASTDVQLRTASTRHAYGLFTRFAVAKPLVFLIEADAVLQKAEGRDLGTGVVGMAQADLELHQGVHLMATGEARRQPFGTVTSLGEWLSAVWFLAPHTDLRVDGIYQYFPGEGGGPAVKSTILLVQMHVYL